MTTYQTISNITLLLVINNCSLFGLVDHHALFFSTAAIHQEAPEFVDMSVEQNILETGIKVVDMLAPYAKGGKIGMFPSGCYICSISLCDISIFKIKCI